MPKEKEFTIIVNTREKIVNQKVLTFEEIVSLAFDDPPSGPNICFTVTFRQGSGHPKEGDLEEGGSVKIKDGTIFNVAFTDKS